MDFRHLALKTALCVLFAAAAGVAARADQLELVNGDHYQGTVLFVTQSNVEFQSEVQGRITLPRDKVARITLRETAVPKPATNAVAPRVGPSLILQGTNNYTPGIAAPAQADAVLQQMRQDGMDPKLVSQVQEQVFGQGNPAAAQKFNELMGGLMSGTLSVSDIRAQAQESIKEIKDARQELGPEVGDSLDGYLAILENFVAESATNNIVSPASPSASAGAKTPGK